MTADDLEGNESGSERRRARAADVERLEARVADLTAAVRAAEDRRSQPLTWIEFCNMAFPAVLNSDGVSRWRSMHQNIHIVYKEYLRAVSGKRPRQLGDPDDPEAEVAPANPAAMAEAKAGC